MNNWIYLVSTGIAPSEMEVRRAYSNSKAAAKYVDKLQKSKSYECQFAEIRKMKVREK